MSIKIKIIFLILIFGIINQLFASNDSIFVTHSISDILQNNTKNFKFNNQNIELDILHLINNQKFKLIRANWSHNGIFVYKEEGKNVSGFIYEIGNDSGYIFNKESENIYLLTVSRDFILPAEEFHQEESKPNLKVSINENKKLPIGNGNIANTLELESRHGAGSVILLDFDGEQIPDWGYSDKSIAPSNYTDEQIRIVWETIAADYLMFDINVTTNPQIFEQYAVQNRIKCAFGEGVYLSNIGGVCPINFFGTGTGCIINSKNGDNMVNQGYVASHELGHSFGLYHDGTKSPGPVVAHHPGHADWAPIMGNGYWKNYVTWSKGDYEFADNQQDDLEIIKNRTGLANDDKTKEIQLVIGKGDTLNWEDNNGIIENSLDVDSFYFVLSDTATIHLLVSPAVAHSNLDIEIELVDENNNSIYKENEILQRWAAVHKFLQAGKYNLLIKSGHENTAFDGFTNYSSFGYYEITGRIPQNILSINDGVIINESVNIFPNPSSDKFIIEYIAVENEKLSVKLISTLGQVCYSNHYTLIQGSNSISIGSESLLKGIYLVVVENENGEKISKKIIVN